MEVTVPYPGGKRTKRGILPRRSVSGLRARHLLSLLKMRDLGTMIWITPLELLHVLVLVPGLSLAHHRVVVLAARLFGLARTMMPTPRTSERAMAKVRAESETVRDIRLRKDRVSAVSLTARIGKMTGTLDPVDHFTLELRIHVL